VLVVGCLYNQTERDMALSLNIASESRPVTERVVFAGLCHCMSARRHGVLEHTYDRR
jgi:hypothetical protein